MLVAQRLSSGQLEVTNKHMEINIFGAIWNKDFTYNVSHQLTLAIENALFFYFNHVSEYSKLNIYISTRVDNITVTSAQHKLNKIKNEIDLNLFLPNTEIKLVSGYVFDHKKFDFVYKENAIKIYPKIPYIQFVFSGLKTFIDEMKITPIVPLEIVKSGLINTIESNSENYNFQPEEIIHLQEIIDKSHWAFNTDSDWLESEIGKKWIALSEKYHIKEDGSLILQNEK